MKHIYMTILALGILASPTMAIAEDAPSTSPTSVAPAHKKVDPAKIEALKAEKKAKWAAMSPEEKKAAMAKIKAKKKARYDAATPEQQAKMKAHREKRIERMKSKRAVTTQ